MNKIMKKTLLNQLKKQVDKELKDTLDGKCLFLCYQPHIPISIKNKIKH